MRHRPDGGEGNALLLINQDAHSAPGLTKVGPEADLLVLIGRMVKRLAFTD